LQLKNIGGKRGETSEDGEKWHVRSKTEKGAMGEIPLFKKGKKHTLSRGVQKTTGQRKRQGGGSPLGKMAVF